MKIVARALLVLLVGVLLPVALIAPQSASAYVDPSKVKAVRNFAKGAGTVRKLTPLRMLANVTPVGIVVNVALTAGLIFLETDQGQALIAGAWQHLEDMAEETKGETRTGTHCQVNPINTLGSSWPTDNSYSFAVSVTELIPGFGCRVTGNVRTACSIGANSGQYVAGRLALGMSSTLPLDAGPVRIASGCSSIPAAAKPTLVLVEVYMPSSAATAYAMTPVIWKRPGFNPATGVRIVTEKTCVNAAGQTQIVEVLGPSSEPNVMGAACPAGYTATRVRILADTGGIRQTLTDTRVDSAARSTYAECLGPNSTGCTMTVYVNGQECAYGVPGCANWWDIARMDPEKVRCHWGPYVLPTPTDCAPIRHYYVTPYGTVIDSGRDPRLMPVPADENGRPLPEAIPKTDEQPSTSTPPAGQPAPAPGGQPGTGTGGQTFPETVNNPAPQPGTRPGFSTGGDTPNCWGGMASWNPVDWVYVPVRCALIWAFVPSDAAVASVQARMVGALSRTAVGEWTAAVGAVGGAFSTGAGEGNCAGPAMNLPEPINATVYPAWACDGGGAILANLMRVGLAAAVVVSGGFACVRLLASGLGYSTSAGASS